MKMGSANPSGFLKFLMRHWVKTLILLVLVAVFLAGPLVGLWNMTLGRFIGSKGINAGGA